MLMDFDRSSSSSSSSNNNNSSSISSNSSNNSSSTTSSNDKSSSNPSLPLLLQMALPSSPFYKGLAAFCDIAFYANASNDHVVHYATAAVARSNPYHDLPSLPEEEEGGVKEWEGRINSSRPTKYKYVVRETRVDLEEAAWRERKEKEMQKEKKNKKKKKSEEDVSTEEHKKKNMCETSHGENGHKEDEEEEEEKEEEGDDEDVQMVGNLPTSHYSPLHPLALSVLFPFIALHALLLMVPFRLVAGLTASNSPALPPSLPPPHPPVEIDEVPELIRRHLSRLPINRVDVFLPGIHTHTKIIVRRPRFSKEGMGVLEHVAARVGRVRVREQGKEG